MKILVVTDANHGMLFNNRRQSKDRVLREKIIEICGESTLWMNAFSAAQFLIERPAPKENFELKEILNAQGLVNIQVDEDFLNLAGEDAFCFVENPGLLPYEEKIDTIYLFGWDVAYPADVYLDLIPSEEKWTLESVEEFAGYSHEKITLQIWNARK